MSDADLLEEITKIFREIMDDDSITLTPDTTAADVPGWDSVVHVTLVVAVETHFHIKFQTAEIESLRNVSDLIRMIAKKLENKRS